MANDWIVPHAPRVYACRDCSHEQVCTTNHRGDCYPTCLGACRHISNPHTAQERDRRNNRTRRVYRYVTRDCYRLHSSMRSVRLHGCRYWHGIGQRNPIAVTGFNCTTQDKETMATKPQHAPGGMTPMGEEPQPQHVEETETETETAAEPSQADHAVNVAGSTNVDAVTQIVRSIAADMDSPAAAIAATLVNTMNKAVSLSGRTEWNARDFLSFGVMLAAVSHIDPALRNN